jgi:hypothetical protein
MGLGTSYPASTGGRPRPGDGGPAVPPAPTSSSRAASQQGSVPDWYNAGSVTPSTMGPMSPFNQAISDFGAINKGQSDALMAQYLN